MNLREKWNNYYKRSCLKRISYIHSDKVLIVEKNEEVFSNDLTKFDAIILLQPLNHTFDLIDFFNKLKSNTKHDCKIFFFYFSKRWLPIFKLLNFLKITKKLDHDEFSYISKNKINLFLRLCDYSINTSINSINFLSNSKYLNFFLNFINMIVPFLDIFSFCKIECISLKNKANTENLSVSIIIPCRNEENNISLIFEELKKINCNFEAIFVDDNSTDNTKIKIEDYINSKSENKNIRLVSGEGLNKYRAVRKGVKNSLNEVCIILDADLAVKAKEIDKCISLMQRYNLEFINCSRFIYRQKKFSMRFLNFLGNKFFALLFSLIVKDNVTDTLCGTKAFYRKDWILFEEFGNKTNNHDQWGDFNLIFGSYFHALKVQEFPVRYYARVSGKSKMNNRFKRFLKMLLACYYSFLIFNN